eukprot:CAMPEP_0202454440 /NCGR_PEP_ID=MMETSP1360-20130828/12172_1 /ASSEMBLY_ACC=CAM_ASM_000848 /TAXON_ID=515479 /ORGANISM="Licmophora paradoxa, Strain CCMP2313" /LENGTH=283 /DNA_ID=CAMNT_0049073755 /DNA_START=46 /DNA_END=897 /DNA_ORIENTATION=+
MSSRTRTQKIRYPRNADGQICLPTSYDSLRKPLPPPPKGHAWHYNHHNREWKVFPQHLLPPLTPLLNKQNQQQQLEQQLEQERQQTEKDDLSEQEQEEQKQQDPPPLDPSKYYRHTVHHTDTFQGICLRYGIKPTQLRQLNHFSGSNLLLAPSVLIIPVDADTVVQRNLIDASQFVVPKEYKIRSVLHGVNNQNNGNSHSDTAIYGTTRISALEAKAYLELNDWDIEKAVQNAKEDSRFEAEEMNTYQFQQQQQRSHSSYNVGANNKRNRAFPTAMTRAQGLV